MAAHTAKSLFVKNLKGAEECLKLYDCLVKLQSGLDSSWLLRSVIVFSTSAMDSYFHDKIRYRAGRYAYGTKPRPMSNFNISISDLEKWEAAHRKGNVLRNWIVEYYSIRPLQKKEEIADALKIVDIEKLWETIEPNTPLRNSFFTELKSFVDRRNKIVHEGDLQRARSSGKTLSPIQRQYADDCIKFVTNLVNKVETHFPN